MSLPDRIARRFAALEQLAERFMGAANVIPFKPKPSGPSIAIGGRKYALSDYFPMMSDMSSDMTGGPQGDGARLIDVGGPRFSYLWAFDTEKKRVSMWRVSDGDNKADGTSSQHMSDVIKLDRKGQLNRVTHDEFRAIERFMSDKQDDTLKSMKEYLESVADDWDRKAKELAQELFDERFLPAILAKFREVESGVKPIGFKVSPTFLFHRSEEDQAKMFVAEQAMKGYNLKALDDFARSKGFDPDNPPGDIQALDWGQKDVRDEFYDTYFK